MATGLNTRDDDTLRVLADSLSDSGLEAAVERMAELLKRRSDARGYIGRPLSPGNYAAEVEVGRPGRGSLNQAKAEADRDPSGDMRKLQHVFEYHDNPSLIPKYVAIRTAARHYTEVVMANVPPCPDRTVALRAIRESVMWSNAALALDGVSL